MDKIEVIKFLLAEIENEQKRFVDYQKADKEAKKFATTQKGYGESYLVAYQNKFSKFYAGRLPHKSVIEQNLRKIRLLSLDLLKEVDQYGN